MESPAPGSRVSLAYQGECWWFWQAAGPGQRRLSETRSPRARMEDVDDAE